MRKSKISFALYTGLLITLAVFIALYAVCTITGSTANDNKYSKAVFTGEYRADGQGPIKYSSKDEFKNNYSKEIVFKGNLKTKPSDNDFIILRMDDLWAEIKADGKTVATNKRENPTNTPGLSIAYIDTKNIDENTDFEITLNNPYSVNTYEVFSEFFSSAIIGPQNSLYDELVNYKSIEIIIGIVIAFLGIMTFSIAGVLIPKLRKQNFTFALVAVVGGLYLLTDSIYNYLPLIIKNPLICFMIDEGSVYSLSIVFMLYILSSISNKKRRLIITLCTLLIMAGTITAFALQIFGVQDILQSEYIIYAIFAVVLPIVIIMLLKEGLKKKCIESQLTVLSFAPITIAVILDLLNIYLEFMPARIAMRAGIMLTIIIQMINLFIAAKKSYEDSLNYEKMQSELLKSRVTIMISQIQPHFLYNSLTSIAQLCEKNPKQAKTATIDFANYLRGNMNSIKDNAPVPFEQELSHLKTYLSLEKMRFGDDLNVEYDIQTDEFYIPSLTVQPLVENAVKHGVGMKEDGGTVTISSREYDDRYEVVVSDDGVGFDPTKPNPDTSRTHVGIENIKDRLSSMCKGEVIIESEIGKGTISTIKIYKEEE